MRLKGEMIDRSLPADFIKMDLLSGCLEMS